MNPEPSMNSPIASALCIVLVVAAQFMCGLTVLSFFRGRTMSRMPRAEKIAFAVLFGLAFPAFISLMMLFTGARLSGWWWTTIFALCAALLIIRRGSIARLRGRPIAPKPIFSSPAIASVVVAAVVVLFSWNVLAALLLPTMDYDGIVIWSYRLKVLFTERTIYTESLRDPARFVAQPLHPYLLPMIEIVCPLAIGKLSSAAVHVPYILVYAAYIALSVCAARMVQESRRSAVMAASLLLMPVMATGFSMLSAREPFMAVFGLAAVYCLACWQRRRSVEYLLAGAFFVLVMQQTKIEGLPLAAGWIIAVLFDGLMAGDTQTVAVHKPGVFNRSRFARIVIILSIAIGLMFLALPWHMVKSGIPRAHADPFMSDYSLSSLVSPRHLPFACLLIIRDALFRPEYYAFAGFAVLAGLATGWRWRNAAGRAVLLSAPIVCLCAAAAIYSQRQKDLPPERNASVSRRVVVFFPALVFAAWHIPPVKKREIISAGNTVRLPDNHSG